MVATRPSFVGSSVRTPTSDETDMGAMLNPTGMAMLRSVFNPVEQLLTRGSVAPTAEQGPRSGFRPQ